MNNLVYQYNCSCHIEFKSEWNLPWEEKATWRWGGHSRKGRARVP